MVKAMLKSWGGERMGRVLLMTCAANRRWVSKYGAKLFGRG